MSFESHANQEIERMREVKTRADERERCAKFVENLDDGPLITKGVKSYIAAALRANGP